MTFVDGSNAEVDFLMSYQGNPLPIEVKAGKAGTLRSLHSFIHLSGASYAVRFYGGPISVETVKIPTGETYRLINLPWFLAAKVRQYVALVEN